MSRPHAEVLGQETNLGVFIRVKNAPEVVRSRGAVASLVQSIAPATTEAEVYKGLAAELRKALKDKNIDADVQVVEQSAGLMKPTNNHLWSDVGLAVGGAGVVTLLAWLLTRRSGRSHK